ncbi:unnamed protein product, partial [Dracunculus medinensis]|uniref:peptidyl-tRNA hydrolase n=1 Tax=Dracunculus medinensis TaxID=318479 RepID=A0A0N4U4A5_DRAME
QKKFYNCDGINSAINWILEHSNESEYESDVNGYQVAMGAHKMIFVINMNLKMGTGKLAAQVGHASISVYRLAQRKEEGQRALEAWRACGEMKVVVKGQNTEHLLELFKMAKDLRFFPCFFYMGLFAYVVSDAGRTQIPAGSRTVLAIFGPSDLVDSVTGQLKLL